jgi:hypothetical protein
MSSRASSGRPESASPAITTEDVADRVIARMTSLVESEVQQERVSSVSQETFALQKATNLISAMSGFSIEEKVYLRRYFCRNIAEAGSLPENDPTYLAAIFRDILNRLQDFR